MIPSSYKRLYFYEPLLTLYDSDKVFEILNYNEQISEDRKEESTVQTNRLHYIANMGGVYNYPPSYLNMKKFALYKICQNLKKRIE